MGGSRKGEFESSRLHRISNQLSMIFLVNLSTTPITVKKKTVSGLEEDNFTIQNKTKSRLTNTKLQKHEARGCGYEPYSFNRMVVH